MAIALALAEITDYNLCANFIIDNGSDFYIINYFYRDHIMNICPANGIKVRHDPDLILIELISDVYYNAYD